MDKETLSNYGWIVICVLVLAVMIALAGPFGNFVANAVKSTTQGLFDVNQGALNAAGTPGLTMPDQKFQDNGQPENKVSTPVKFGQPYSGAFVDDTVGELVFIFYADGSHERWEIKQDQYSFCELSPAGTFTYTETEIVVVGEGALTVSADGTSLSMDGVEIMKLKPITTGNVKNNVRYKSICPGVEYSIMFNEDGTINYYLNNEIATGMPTYTYDGRIIKDSSGTEYGMIFPDGNLAVIGNGIIFEIVE